MKKLTRKDLVQEMVRYLKSRDDYPDMLTSLNVTEMFVDNLAKGHQMSDNIVRMFLKWMYRTTENRVTLVDEHQVDDLLMVEFGESIIFRKLNSDIPTNTTIEYPPDILKILPDMIMRKKYHDDVTWKTLAAELPFSYQYLGNIAYKRMVPSMETANTIYKTLFA